MKKLVALVMTALCLLAVGCSKQEDDQIIDVVVPSTPEAVVTPIPTPETPAETPAPAYTSPYTEQIAAQKAKNDETVGWIKIQGTNINYPIMFDTTGKLGYYNMDSSKKKSELGSVYMHFNVASADAAGVGQNLIVTAHNNRVAYSKGNYENGFFHELHHIQSVNEGKTNCGYDEKGRTCPVTLDSGTLPNLMTPEGRTWDISVDGIDAQWEVWAFYEVKKNEPGSTLYYNTWWPYDNKDVKYTFKKPDTAFVQEWINKQLERSEVNLGVTPSTSDQFMTIYTCGDNHDSSDAQSRLYFFLRQVNPASTKFGGTAAATETTPAA